MIKLNRVSKSFGASAAVRHISFSAEDGEKLVILGTSGSGKTTTLRMINRLLEISSGSISVKGKNVEEWSLASLRRQIGYVLQHHGLFPHYTVAQNIAIVPHLLKWDAKKTKARVGDLTDRLRLPREVLEQFPHQLSGGQQQRVGLARALAADPEILLMDEPFGALDAVTRSQVVEEFVHLDLVKNKTIVMVTHDIGEAFRLGDKIILMHEGRIEQSGTPKELLFQPKSTFVRQFFDSQRMRFELQALNYSDIEPLITDPPTGQHPAPGTSLWQLLQNGEGNDDDHSPPSIGPAQIFAAFQQFKDRQA